MTRQSPDRILIQGQLYDGVSGHRAAGGEGQVYRLNGKPLKNSLLQSKHMKGKQMNMKHVSNIEQYEKQEPT